MGEGEGGSVVLRGFFFNFFNLPLLSLFELSRKFDTLIFPTYKKSRNIMFRNIHCDSSESIVGFIDFYVLTKSLLRSDWTKCAHFLQDNPKKRTTKMRTRQNCQFCPLKITSNCILVLPKTPKFNPKVEI